MTTTKTARIEGVLVGQACADALGSGYEFSSGPKDGEDAVMRPGAMGFATGEFTDDTQQAVMVALARADIARTANGLIEWYQAHPRDVGGTTSAVLSRATDAASMAQASIRHGMAQASQHRPGKHLPGSANGSLMRTGPVALAHLGDRSAIARAAREISDLTHADPEGWNGDACVIWSLVIDTAIEQGESFYLPTALGYALSYVDGDHREFWAELVNEALYGDRPTGRNGGALAAFRVAVWAIAHSDSYEGAVQQAIKCGHDTDTTAAIAGALAGAIYGSTGIPDAYRRAVHGWPIRNGLYVNGQGLAAIARQCAGIAPEVTVWPRYVPAEPGTSPSGLSPAAKAGGAPASTDTK